MKFFVLTTLIASVFAQSEKFGKTYENYKDLPYYKINEVEGTIDVSGTNSKSVCHQACNLNPFCAGYNVVYTDNKREEILHCKWLHEYFITDDIGVTFSPDASSDVFIKDTYNGDVTLPESMSIFVPVWCIGETTGNYVC